MSTCFTCRPLSDLLYRFTKELAFWFPGGRYEHYGTDFDGWPQNTWLLPLRVWVDGQKNAEWDAFFWRISFRSLRAPLTHSFFSDCDGLPPIYASLLRLGALSFLFERSRAFCGQHFDLQLYNSFWFLESLSLLLLTTLGCVRAQKLVLVIWVYLVFSVSKASALYSEWLLFAVANLISLINLQQYCNNNTFGFPWGRTFRYRLIAPPSFRYSPNLPCTRTLFETYIPQCFLFNIYLYYVLLRHVNHSFLPRCRQRMFFIQRGGEL